MKIVRKISALALALSGVLAFTACAQNKTIEVKDISVIHETKFNSSYIELTNDEMKSCGFDFGDSCNVYFSNGETLTDIPYYDGYYTRSDVPLICGYQGYPYVQITENNVSDFWDKHRLSETMTVNIVLNEKAKYLTVQEAFSMHYFNEREKYQSDEVFANFRQVKTSNIKENRLYRGASPFNDTYKRIDYVDNLLEEKQVKFILDLSDTESDIEIYKVAYIVGRSYALMQDKACLGLGSNFRSDAYKASLAKGLKEMIKHDGPYYVHCVEGKDRTGFVCTLLEALCGAGYQELKDDYMITYYNYFGITKADAKYEAVSHLRFDEFLEYLTGETDVKNLSYEGYARTYLSNAGMTDAEINELIEVLTK